jgi:hypothetical protein
MSAVVEILIELIIRLFGFAARNLRVIFALLLGAGIGLALGISFWSLGGASIWVVFMAVVIGAVVIAPKVVAYLNRIAPGR